MASRRREFLLSFLLSTAAVGLLAYGRADAPNFPEVGPAVQNQPGLPIVATWRDGRVASMMISRLPAQRLPMPFTVIENTCQPSAGQLCQFGFGVRVDHLRMIWTSHPDAAKLGKTLHFGEDEIFREEIATDVDTVLKPVAAAGLPKFEMTCADYSWLPGGAVGVAPERFDVSRWEVEIMTENEETGLQENRANGGAYRVRLGRTAAGNLATESIGNFIGGTQPTLFYGDVVSLIVAKRDGEHCQISLKTDQGTAVTAFGRFLRTVKDSYVPYLSGSDENSPTQMSDFLRFTANTYDSDNKITVTKEREVE